MLITRPASSNSMIVSRHTSGSHEVRRDAPRPPLAHPFCAIITCMNYSHTFGLSFGLLTVKSQGEKRDLLMCLCACGNAKTARLSHLRSGSVRSCGCLLKTMPKMVHGKTLASTTLEYKTWDAMIRRCHQPSHFAFHNYGARGITVCERWRGDAGFGNFLADMGHKHRGESLDRINNDDGYSPENCRWTGRHIQANNRRGNIRFESLGKSLTLAEWSRLTGTSDNTMRERLKRGWTVDDSIHGRIKLP